MKLVSHCDSSYMTHLDKLAVDFNIKIKEKFLVLTYPTFGFSINIHKKKKKKHAFNIKIQKQIC